jgi:hypothetical protein
MGAPGTPGPTLPDSITFQEIADGVLVASMFTPLGPEVAGGAAAARFFEGAAYTDKVRRQMNAANDLYHGFPVAVDALAAEAGQVTKIVGGDGAAYLKLQVDGVVNNVKGAFTYIKDTAGNINHRLFEPYRKP